MLIIHAQPLFTFLVAPKSRKRDFFVTILHILILENTFNRTHPQ